MNLRHSAIMKNYQLVLFNGEQDTADSRQQAADSRHNAMYETLTIMPPLLHRFPVYRFINEGK